MPRQNRVTPFGEIVAIPERGMVMGNRGVLHDADQRLRRSWCGRRWILCRLEFRGRRRMVMAPNRYTELFFLDEATGLAAGHRPCFECRRTSFTAFVDAWAEAFPETGRPNASAIDDRLHAERIGPHRAKQVSRARLADLPDGVLVTLESAHEQAYLLWKGRLHEWSPSGYRTGISTPATCEVEVLTPRSTIEVIRLGYAPAVHPSAEAVALRRGDS